jgi:hypothetical protein
MADNSHIVFYLSILQKNEKYEDIINLKFFEFGNFLVLFFLYIKQKKNCIFMTFENF